jgi:CheY-like chemotaxis protein
VTSSNPDFANVTRSEARALQGLGRLTAGIAHDFNNILAIIHASAQMITETTEGEPRHRARDILDAVARAATLTRDLLGLCRRDGDPRRTAEVNTVVQTTVALLRRILGEDIEIATTLTGGRAASSLAPSLLTHVIVSLAVDARDAMPRGGKLTIESQATSYPTAIDDRDARVPAGEWIVLSFAHATAPGIDADGGLAAAREAVAEIGGLSAVEEVAGVGRTVRLYLPRVAASPLESRSCLQPAPAPAGVAPILLVEDEPQLRRVLKRALSRTGYEVLDAANVAEALAIVEERQGHISLYVVDVVLTDQPGTALAEAVRLEHPEAPILFMSGYPRSTLVSWGIRGTERVIQKPFSAPQLAAEVLAALSGSAEAA